MSDALDYLLDVRKDAIQPYFKFLKEGGKHLDDKTRFLLSVITKVNAQTEAGLKQYLKRALKEGNSADEILDAMLVCMPTLGLSKIIWAVDIILKMELPEFDPEKLGKIEQTKAVQTKKKQWHKLIEITDIKEGASRFEYGKQACFVSRDGDDFIVFDSICPHKASNIPGDAIDGMTLECPMHHWKFNLENGECIENGNQQPLTKIKYKIEGNYLFVYS
ncbi:MAG TPA: carboxymuconolactone decarboxylase [Thiotrichaceae bacterium]|jgi:nitrite reductase/ring-hydroxylating ferredoxin subunit/alkylhydroperoxidase/carboxymuconolactone decarboxylase family protein YurZ|nr:carboxymuconolactone decarboxylase [Thiotrichaceae bacterium]HIM06968.1 carboxymuconolactone decarboxylase [Gammaproteobacteria bacterium]